MTICWGGEGKGIDGQEMSIAFAKLAQGTLSYLKYHTPMTKVLWDYLYLILVNFECFTVPTLFNIELEKQKMLDQGVCGNLLQSIGVMGDYSSSNNQDAKRKTNKK